MEHLRRPRMSFARLIGAGSAITLLLFTAVVRSGVNTWTSTGPDGGWVYGLAWHPTRDGVLLAAVNARVYRSTNSGQQWSSVSPFTPVTGSFVFDPNNADRILVSGQPVLRSDDGGASFLPASPLPGFVGSTRLVITPDGTKVYAAAGGAVFRTSDFGQSWTSFSTGLPGGSSFATALQLSPSDPNTLYVSYQGSGVYKTTNAGASWTKLTTPAGMGLWLAINPNNSAQLLVSSPYELWRSIDAGATWTFVQFGGFFWFDFDPLVANRVLAYNYQTKRLLVSTDAGGAWLQAASVPSVQGSAGAFSHTTPGKFAFGSSEGSFLSSDAGQTVAFRSSGLLSTSVRALAASRTAPFRVYASFYGGPDGVHLLSSGTWQPLAVSQMFSALSGRSPVESLAVDPNNSSIVYAGTSYGLAKSTDGGASWSVPTSTFNLDLPYSIAVDPSNTQVVYVASTSLGIMRSIDGGANWSSRNNGLPVIGGNVSMLRVFIDPADSQKLYAVQQSSGTLFRTIDAGLNWTQVAGGLPGNEVSQAIAFDSLNANRVYLGTYSGLFRSMDGGSSWTPMTLPIGADSIFSVLVDPATPGNITLVSASTIGVIRSVDYGATWERLPYPSDRLDPARLGILDPGQPGLLHVGTYQAGMQAFQVEPDMAVSISGLANQLPLGSTPTLRLTAQNKASSPYAASDATVSLTLPAVLIPGTISTTRGTCTRTGQNFTCRLGAMQVGDVAQIDLPLTVISGTGNFSASVAPRETELAAADNALAMTVAVQPFANLSATLTQPATVNHGATVDLSGRITNAGPNTADNSRLVFTLPSGLIPVNAAGANGSCAISAGVVTCLTGTMAANTSATFNVQATANGLGSQGVQANAIADPFDPDTANNLASASVTVLPVTDLAITLSSPGSSMVTGQTGNSTATITNNGPDPVTIAVATISGTNLNVVTATPVGGSCAISAGAADCSMGTLAVGAQQDHCNHVQPDCGWNRDSFWFHPC